MNIRKVEQGLEQFCYFANLDRTHEEIREIGILESAVHITDYNENSKLLNFLILGDQNSGKSTFLQSFSKNSDAKFSSLMSAIPFISSSFINLRLNREGESYMDEPPYLDTDIARALCVITIDDYNFYCYEHNLQTLNDFVSYVIFNFIEIGGDHLDRLMHFIDKIDDQFSKYLKPVLENSLYFLKNAQVVSYFINYNSLFTLIDNCVVLNKNHLLLIQDRLRFLYNVCNIKRMLFFLCRTPEEDNLDINLSLNILNEIFNSSLSIDETYTTLGLIEIIIKYIYPYDNYDLNVCHFIMNNSICIDCTNNVLKLLINNCYDDKDDVIPHQSIIKYLLNNFQNYVKDTRYYTFDDIIYKKLEYSVNEFTEYILDDNNCHNNYSILPASSTLKYIRFIIHELSKFGFCLIQTKVYIFIKIGNDDYLGYKPEISNDFMVCTNDKYFNIVLQNIRNMIKTANHEIKFPEYLKTAEYCLETDDNSEMFLLLEAALLSSIYNIVDNFYVFTDLLMIAKASLSNIQGLLKVNKINESEILKFVICLKTININIIVNNDNIIFYTKIKSDMMQIPEILNHDIKEEENVNSIIKILNNIIKHKCYLSSSLNDHLKLFFKKKICSSPPVR